MIRGIALLLLLSSLKLDAAAEIFQIDEEQSYLCSFSFTEPNRISIEGGAIKKVFFHEGDLSVVLDEESGQVFVSPSKHDAKVATLCVLSDQKKMQNLQIAFEDRDAGIVILKEKKQKSSILSTVEQIFAGQVPKDYELFKKKLPANKGVKGVYFRCLRALENEQEILFVWELSNLSRKVLQINEEALKTAKDEYYLVQKTRLQPSEKTLAISARKKS